MVQIRCTKKVLDMLGSKNFSLSEYKETDALLGNWYANIFTFERKKHIIFMNDKTYLSFVCMGVRKDNIKFFSNLFCNGFEQLLQFEGIDESIIQPIIKEYQTLEITKTFSRSIVGNLNDLVYSYNASIYNQGGLLNCDLTEISKNLNRMIQRNLDWSTPIERIFELLGIGNPRDMRW